MRNLIRCILFQFIGTLISFSILSCNKKSIEPTPVFTIREKLELDEYLRTFTIHLPPDYYENNRSYPLVVGLHGTGGNANQFAADYNFSSKADSAGFIAVYPEGVPRPGFLGIRTWNAGTCCDFAADNHVRDVEFIRLVIAHLKTKYRVGEDPIYIAGISNGGMLAYRLAAELPGTFAGMAIVSSTMMLSSLPSIVDPIPVLHIHSELDEKIPLNGGIGIADYYYPPVDSVLSVWAHKYKCDSIAVIDEERELYKKTTWKNCNNSISIQLYTTKDGGHSWPGGKKSRQAADDPSKAFNATDLIWEFLSKF